MNGPTRTRPVPNGGDASYESGCEHVNTSSRVSASSTHFRYFRWHRVISSSLMENCKLRPQVSTVAPSLCAIVTTSHHHCRFPGNRFVYVLRLTWGNHYPLFFLICIWQGQTTTQPPAFSTFTVSVLPLSSAALDGFSWHICVCVSMLDTVKA